MPITKNGTFTIWLTPLYPSMSHLCLAKICFLVFPASSVFRLIQGLNLGKYMKGSLPLSQGIWNKILIRSMEIGMENMFSLDHFQNKI